MKHHVFWVIIQFKKLLIDLIGYFCAIRHYFSKTKWSILYFCLLTLVTRPHKISKKSCLRSKSLIWFHARTSPLRITFYSCFRMFKMCVLMICCNKLHYHRFSVLNLVKKFYVPILENRKVWSTFLIYV